MIRSNSLRFKGVKKHLEESKDIHNGYGYEAFLKMMDLIDNKIAPKSVIAKAFGVRRSTANEWIRVWREQR